MKRSGLKRGIIDFFTGTLIGAVNGLFGSGGGMITVPMLTNKGFSQKDAQRNAVAIILPLSVISSALYIINGRIAVSDAFPYLPGGIAGAIAGTALISKLSPKLLKGIFGGFMIYAGIRLLLR